MAAVNEDIAYLSDIRESEPVPPGATEGNVPVFDGAGKLLDSHKKLSDFYGKEAVDSKIQELRSACDDIVNSIHDGCAVASYTSPVWAPVTSYSVGEFCRYGNPVCGYRCKEAHVSGSAFAPSKWELVLSNAGKQALDGLLVECGKDKAPLLSLADLYSPSKRYNAGELAIKDGKLQICTAGAYGAGATFSTDVTIDKVISSRVDDALKEVLLSFETLVPVVDQGEEVVRYDLADRAVNSIVDAMPEGYGIRLGLPAQRQVAGLDRAREFVVEFNIPASQEVPAGTSVEVGMDGEYVDCLGGEAQVSAVVGQRCSYRFLETSRAAGRFVVSGSLERRLNSAVEQLMSGMFRSGIYLPDETTGLMHKVTVTRDAELDEENISVNKEGVP